ncbi:hypothetical protein NPIL_632691 [Nephila pilipes]|uniref:Uncharacterized protein n=1 Tax=Nephila pilipes TaxID=299642 RepID=A0A8X6TZC2_NEPPI|nr:hypothetical protein NPIL_632691 [Nephila pilipes]
MNEESATVALCKFQLEKNVQTRKKLLTVADHIKLVQRFEEVRSRIRFGSLEDRDRSGQPMKVSACIIRQTISLRETLASKSSLRSNSAREAGRRFSYQHARYATIFMEFLIRIHTNYSLAMNSYRRISLRKKHL